MEVKAVNVGFDVLKSETSGFILIDPGTFKIDGKSFKVALQANGLALISSENPNKLVTMNLTEVLAEAIKLTVE